MTATFTRRYFRGTTDSAGQTERATCAGPVSIWGGGGVLCENGVHARVTCSKHGNRISGKLSPFFNKAHIKYSEFHLQKPFNLTDLAEHTLYQAVSQKGTNRIFIIFLFSVYQTKRNAVDPNTLNRYHLAPHGPMRERERKREHSCRF